MIISFSAIFYALSGVDPVTGTFFRTLYARYLSASSSGGFDAPRTTGQCEAVGWRSARA